MEVVRSLLARAKVAAQAALNILVPGLPSGLTMKKKDSDSLASMSTLCKSTTIRRQINCIVEKS